MSDNSGNENDDDKMDIDDEHDEGEDEDDKGDGNASNTPPVVLLGGHRNSRASETCNSAN